MLGSLTKSDLALPVFRLQSNYVWLVEARHISPGQCQPVSARYKYDSI